MESRRIMSGAAWHGTGAWIGRAGPVLTAALLLAAQACGDGPSGTGPGETRAGGPADAATTVRTVSEVEVPAPARPADTPVATAAPSRPVTFAEAEQAYSDGRYGEAVELFRAYARQKPGVAWGRYMLGLAAWKAGKTELAEEALRAALDQDPTHLKSLVNLSRVLVQDGRASDAVGPIGRALDQAPDDPVVLRVAGNVRLSLGQLDEAEHLYRASARRDAGDPWTLNDLGLALIRQGQYSKALAPLARAVDLEPDRPAFQNNLGAALERTGHPEQAAHAYRAALDAEPDYTRAQVSLERVRDRKPADGVTPVDLAALAESFDAGPGRPSAAAATPAASEPVVPAADSVRTGSTPPPADSLPRVPARTAPDSLGG